MAATAILKKGEGRLLKQGGQWIFDNEIQSITGDYAPGDILTVQDFDGYPLGQGFINPHSKIRIRMLCRNTDSPVNEDFFRRRLERAWAYRKKCVDTNACRLVFGEADALPGLVMDKFGDILVVQTLALGIDRWLETLIRLMREILAKDGVIIRGVYERNDGKEREKEGLPRRKGFLGEAFEPRVQILENGVKYWVDVAEGQKTGFFLDQKYNRLAIQKLCKDARVLDGFTHTGSFALNAALAGAADVLGVDASELGIRQAQENALLNGLQDRVRFLCADVFELLPQLEKQQEKYDVVILDPPAFTKSRDSVKNAVKGYREINLRAMKLIKNNGFLATCSCSHFMDNALFAQTIHQAARNVHKQLRQVEYRTQAPDHPVLWDAQESFYLKFYIFQVSDPE